MKQKYTTIYLWIKNYFPLYTLFLPLLYTALFPLDLFACIAYDGLFEIKQPSGKTFEARQRGDEWRTWIETKDGYGIYKNTITGNWEYYVPAGTISPTRENGHLAKKQDAPAKAIVGEADPYLLGIPKGLCPARDEIIKQKPFDSKKADTSALSGTIQLLVIGVEYEDTPASYSFESVQSQFFGTGNTVSNYYSTVSYSSVTITTAKESHGTQDDGFIGWLKLSGKHPNPEQYTDITTKSAARAQIAKDAILAADAYIDFSSYDTNNNNIIEPTELPIMIVVAGYEASYSSIHKPAVWPHRGSLAPNYPSVDGKQVHDYAEFGEKQRKYGETEDHLTTIGVMAHELGHLTFSLPDLYDLDNSSWGIGDFDLMGSGSWGAVEGAYHGSSPTLLSAWCREYLSWGTAATVSSSQTISFPKADGNAASVFRMNTSDPNQYFLVENRQFTGYDAGFQYKTGASGHGGLVIYHIDSQKTPPVTGDVNNNENNKGIDVEEANEGILGYSMLDSRNASIDTNMFFFSGNNDSFTDTTIPNSKLKNGNSTNISITDISVYGDTMTASVARPPTVKTYSATNMTSDSVILNGTVNAYAESTTVWFEYGTIGGSYGSNSGAQTISGTTDTAVSIKIDGLSSGVTYYFRIAAMNSTGTVYGEENTFALITSTPKISAGTFHSLALKSDGSVWSWGFNSYGQLGNGSTTTSYTPVQVKNLAGVIDIAGGGYHSLALKSDGTVWSWGFDAAGQLGNGTDTGKNTPVKVSNLSDVTAIAGGWFHSLALKKDGTVWAWGLNSFGQLGDGTYDDKNTPVQVSGITGITAIAGGGNYSLALKSDGITTTVWTWGSNEFGQLGDGTNKNNSNTPVQVSGLDEVIAIDGGWGHGLALKSNGTVRTWGWNNGGQLGDGTYDNKNTPVQVSNITGITAIASGGNHSLALKSDGIVWTWGYGKEGQLGNGTDTSKNTPVQAINLSDIITITGNIGHPSQPWGYSIALKTNGTVWTWGINNYGQLGDGTNKNRNTPVLVDINLGSISTPVATPSITIAPTPTMLPSPTVTPQATLTPTPASTPTPVQSPTVTPQVILTSPPIPTPTLTPLPTTTPLSTPTPFPTLSPTPTTSPVLNKGSIYGTAYDYIDDSPLQGVTVSIKGNDYSSETTTEENGYFEFANLTGGTYKLTFTKDGYKSKSKSVSIEENEEKALTVYLIKMSKITGYVVDFDTNDPVASARVWYINKGGKVTAKNITQTDDNGYFEFKELPRGYYVVYARKKGYKQQQVKIKLQQGETKEISISLKKKS